MKEKGGHCTNSLARALFCLHLISKTVRLRQTCFGHKIQILLSSAAFPEVFYVHQIFSESCRDAHRFHANTGYLCPISIKLGIYRHIFSRPFRYWNFVKSALWFSSCYLRTGRRTDGSVDKTLTDPALRGPPKAYFFLSTTTLWLPSRQMQSVLSKALVHHLVTPIFLKSIQHHTSSLSMSSFPSSPPPGLSPVTSLLSFYQLFLQCPSHSNLRTLITVTISGDLNILSSSSYT